MNNRIARSIDPYSYYWNDLKRGDPSHLLRFAKRSGGMDDHMLRFAKKDDPEMAEQAIEETDGGKMDLAKRWYYTRGARGQMNDHMLRFA